MDVIITRHDGSPHPHSYRGGTRAGAQALHPDAAILRIVLVAGTENLCRELLRVGVAKGVAVMQPDTWVEARFLAAVASPGSLPEINNMLVTNPGTSWIEILVFSQSSPLTLMVRGAFHHAGLKQLMTELLLADLVFKRL